VSGRAVEYAMCFAIATARQSVAALTLVPAVE